MLRDALLENLHRAQLNPLEEAAAYDQLLQDFGCTHDELAQRIGRSRPQISNTLRLLRLPPRVQRRVAAGVLSAGHARALLGLDDAGRAGAAGPPHRGRGAVGAGGRGDRRARWRIDYGDGAPGRVHTSRWRRGSRDLAERLSDRSGDPGTSGPRADARAGSRSTSRRSTTSTASSGCSTRPS